jgi:hypothetical protein
MRVLAEKPDQDRSAIFQALQIKGKIAKWLKKEEFVLGWFASGGMHLVL